MKKTLPLLMFLSLVGMACTNPNTSVETKSFLFNADDFDLQTITGLVKSGDVNGAEELESLVNSDNGINNVDIDNDGNIDYVSVVEGRNNGIVLDFVAQPSSGAGESVTISTLRFSHNTVTNEVAVSGAYPRYARGYDSRYYSYSMHHRPGITIGEAMFVSWLLMPSRSVYARPYMRTRYSPRARYSSSRLSQTRTTLKTTKKISPIKSKVRPASYKPSKRATKSASKFKASSKAKGKTFDSRKGKVKAFTKRDPNKAQRPASSFGKKAKKPSSKTSGFGSSSAKKKSTWGSSSKKTKPKKKSSWGNSSGKKKSNFGRSRSRSRSRRR